MKQLLKIGNVVDDGTGDYLREGGSKINNNFEELYSELGDGSTPSPAGAWKTIKSSNTTTLNAQFGKSYAVDTSNARMQVNLPKGTSSDYNKVIRIRDTFATWQANQVTISPANGDTLKGSSDSEVFNTNFTDLEMVYCAPGRWEYLANKLLNKISNGDIATVMKKEFICEQGQTDFTDLFGRNEYNLLNTQVYLRGNLLYYGTELSDQSDYGSIGSNGSLVPLDGKTIKLKRPAEAGDTLMVITYLDGIAQWRSTYNRLDCSILSDKISNLQSVAGSRLVTNLDTFKTITPEQLGYTLTSNSGLINPNTLEVYVNGVILNEAGTAGTSLMKCQGADSDNQDECILLGGQWVQSNYDYTYQLNDNGAIESITFGRDFEHEDVITIKWFNNNIGTTLEMDEIVDKTDQLYISGGAPLNLTGQIRVTDYNNPNIQNTEPLGNTTLNINNTQVLFDVIYPIGTVYENFVNPNNPSTYMGMGVWVLAGTKRMLVGWTDDNKDTEFGLNNNYLDNNGNPTHTAGGTGGTRNITINNENLPPTQSTEKALIVDNSGTVVVGGCQFDPDEEGPAYHKYREDFVKTNTSQSLVQSIDTLSPYLTVYRWMRVA